MQLRKPVSNKELRLYVELLQSFYNEYMTSEEIVLGLADEFGIEASVDDLAEANILTLGQDGEDVRLIMRNVL